MYASLHSILRAVVDVTRTLVATPGPFVTGRLVEIRALEWSFPISGGIKTLCRSRFGGSGRDCEEHVCTTETTDHLNDTQAISLCCWACAGSSSSSDSGITSRDDRGFLLYVSWTSARPLLYRSFGSGSSGGSLVRSASFLFGVTVSSSRSLLL